MCSVDSFALAGETTPSAPMATHALRALYDGAPAVAGRARPRPRSTRSRTTARCGAAAYTPANGAVYPTTAAGHALRDVARLIKGDVGLQVACRRLRRLGHARGPGRRGRAGGCTTT